MFEPFLSDFLKHLKFGKHYSTHTLVAYQNDLAVFAAFLQNTFGEMPIADVSHTHIRSWVASMKNEGLTEKSLKRKLSACSAFFKYLLKTEVVTSNPIKKLHSLKIQKPLPQYLEQNQTAVLFDDIEFAPDFEGRTQRLILEILYQCGLRRSELINLKASDIEWSLNQIRILGKGHKERLVPIAEGLKNKLRDYHSEKKRLFETPSAQLLVLKTGKALYPNYVYRTVVNYLERVSTLQKNSPHILRHTFATQLLSNGANIQSIKELLGHSSLAATQVYTHLAIDQLKDIHKKSHPKG